MLDPVRPRFGLLFLANCPLRVRDLTDRFGTDRAAFGFPGAGGVMSDQTVSYFRVRQQPTTFGPVLGQSSLKANEMAQLFSGAGFATSVVPDMEAWLKTHAFLIAAICGALYQNGGLSVKLAAHRPSLRLLRRGFREGLACVRTLGFTPSPLKLRLLGDTFPEWIVIPILARLFASPMATFAIDGHANAAIDDMHDLALDCRLMIKQSGVAAPNMQQLCALVDAAACQQSAAAGQNPTR
jgi:2-dehydropantoate 2-reductase